MSYLSLPYNPSDFEMDKRYLDGLQIDDIKDFIAERYVRNKDNIKTIVEFFVKAFIESASNIYSLPVNYPEWDMKDKWIEKRRIAIHALEKYRELNKQALLWQYKVNKDWKFKAYHASDFIAIKDDYGQLNYVIIRTGQYLKVNAGSYEVWYYFKLWKDSKVYQTTAENWSSIPSLPENGEIPRVEEGDNNTGWSIDPNQANFDIFPFTLIGNDIAKPVLSTLTIIENIRSGGSSWGEIAEQRAFIDAVYGIGNMAQSKWTEIIDKISAFEFPLIPLASDGVNQNDLKALSLGAGDNQKKWADLLDNSIKKMANALGVDTNGMLGDLKIESGTARRISLEPVVNVRNDKIVIFREFEEENQQLLIKLGITNIESEVEYADLDIGATELEKEQVEANRQANITNRYKNGTITKLQMIQEMEMLNEDQAKKRLNEVYEERGEPSSTNIKPIED